MMMIIIMSPTIRFCSRNQVKIDWINWITHQQQNKTHKHTLLKHHTIHVYTLSNNKKSCNSKFKFTRISIFHFVSNFFILILLAVVCFANDDNDNKSRCWSNQCSILDLEKNYFSKSNLFKFYFAYESCIR